MRRLFCLFFAICFFWPALKAQKDTSDIGELSVDDYDALFSELDAFLDSLIKPRSFGSVSLSAGNRLLNVASPSGQISSQRTVMLSPAAGFYHKSGLGVGGSAAILTRGGKLKPFQYLATASYDYIKSRNIVTGLSYSRIFTEDSLDFYTSPLQNELSGYLVYRKSWVKPSLTFSYGWGSRTSVEEQHTLLNKLRKKINRGNGPGVVTRTETKEQFSDWAVSLSLRHDFYWLNTLSNKDNLRFSPQISLNAGTQKFGFNQTTQTGWRKNSGIVKPFTSEQVALEEHSGFKPLSLTAFLRTAYTRGICYVQPQFIVDYYLPDTGQRWTTTFSVAAGLMF